MLRDASPNGLKSFSETAHVEELQRKAPILHSMLEASTSIGKSGQCDPNMVLIPSVQYQWQLLYCFVQDALR